MDATINNSFDDLFKKYGSIHGINWKILKRISWIESKIGMYKSVRLGIEKPLETEASKSQDGKSWGLMQVTLTTARDYDSTATAAKLNNPEYSVMIAAKHLARVKNSYPQFSERDLVMAYNHGQGNQLKFLDKEKSKTLSLSEFPAGRDYYYKYLQAKDLIP